MRPRTGSGRRAAGWTAALCLVLLTGACAQRAGGATGATGAPTSPSPPPPAAPDALGLRMQRVGGFLPIGVTEASLPEVSIYGDGRAITAGPVAAFTSV